MDDWLDDLLAELPSQSTSAGLVHRVQARLAVARRGESRQRSVGHGLMALAAAAGVWLLLPHLRWIVRAAPAISLAGMADWLRSLVDSPSYAIGEALREAFHLESGLAEGIAPGVAVGLVLLAVPALHVLVSWLGGRARREARL